MAETQRMGTRAGMWEGEEHAVVDDPATGRRELVLWENPAHTARTSLAWVDLAGREIVWMDGVEVVRADVEFALAYARTADLHVEEVVCRCGRQRAWIRTFWGPDGADNHIEQGACKRCGGDLHIGDEWVGCPDCGWYTDVDAEGSVYVGNTYTGEQQCIHDMGAARAAAFDGTAFLIG